MSNWEIKSNKNTQCARLLLYNAFPSSSIHCSYYSIVQLMLHVLNKDLNKTEKQIKKESREGSKEKKGYHNWIKSVIIEELAKRNRRDLRDFNNQFGKIKRLRVKADYENTLTPRQEANDAYNISINLNQMLYKNFEI